MIKTILIYSLDFSAQAGLQHFLLHFSIHHSWENRRRNRYGVLCLLRPWQITIHQHPSFKKVCYLAWEEHCNLPSVPGVKKITRLGLNQGESCSIFLELLIKIIAVFKRKWVKAFIVWPRCFLGISRRKVFNTIITLLHSKMRKLSPTKYCWSVFFHRGSFNIVIVSELLLHWGRVM